MRIVRATLCVVHPTAVLTLQIANPRPVPPNLRDVYEVACEYDLNTLLWSSAAMPMPVSRTLHMWIAGWVFSQRHKSLT